MTAKELLSCAVGSTSYIDTVKNSYYVDKTLLIRDFGTFAELALPNKEIRRVYNTEILLWVKNRMDGNVMSEILCAVESRIRRWKI